MIFAAVWRTRSLSLRALIASRLVRALMLYGGLILRRYEITSGCATAYPSRIPASPQALERVRRTTRLETELTIEPRDSPSEKSMYASSTTTIAGKFRQRVRTSVRRRRFAVGLFGEQQK